MRAARDGKRISIDLASQKARIPARYLRMLEEGSFPTVADPAYLTHFLRRYAEFLGLDPEEAARDLLIETEPETVARRSGRAGERPEAWGRGPARPPLVPLRWAAYGGALVAGLAFLVGVVLFEQRREVEAPRVASRPPAPAPAEARKPPAGVAALPRETAEPPAAPVAEPPPAARISPPETESAAAPLEPPVRAAQPVAPAPQGGGGATLPREPAAPVADSKDHFAATRAAPPSTEPASQAPPPPQPAQPPAEVASGAPRPPGVPMWTPPFELRLTATSRQVWIWIAIDGGPARAISLNRGDTVSFTAEEGYVLSVDDAGGIRASLNGKDLPRLGGSAQVRRNVVIPSNEFEPVGSLPGRDHRGSTG